ncbi:MAG: 16S rRNA (adenine(1518)-N(6)/adenine(1519)-N(6))-dimethyltransferase RsmA [Flavobacteriales bacterium]
MKYESKYNDPKSNDAVRAKKHLGQHFLKDESVSKAIADALIFHIGYNNVLEIGPGMGVLTKYLIENPGIKNFKVVEIDKESVAYLQQNYPSLQIIDADFLRQDLKEIFTEPFAVIGNFPYNISTEILFKILDYRDHVPEVVGMFQKEVAERIAAKPGGKTYGITSVLLQAFYNIEYLFTVEPEVFNPPPKVKSGVIRMKRNQREKLPCDEAMFFKVVKTAFNQRRKTLNNALKSLELNIPEQFKTLRAEVLSVEDYIQIVLANV